MLCQKNPLDVTLSFSSMPFNFVSKQEVRKAKLTLDMRTRFGGALEDKDIFRHIIVSEVSLNIIM